MRLKHRIACVAAMAALGLPAASVADAPGAGESVKVGDEGRVVEKILDILLESGQISERQHEQLLEEAEREQQELARQATAPAAETPAVSEGPTDWNFEWKNGFNLSRNDGAFKLKFGGRIQLDSAGIWQEQSLDEALGGQGTGVELRRARIFFSGTVYERVFFKAAYEFADDTTEFKDLFMGLKDLGPVRDVRVGQFKEPFLLEEWTSSKYITFMERGLNNVFFPGRNVGLMAQGNVAGKQLLWQGGVFRDANDKGFAFDKFSDAGWNLSGRLVGVPLYEESGEQVVHLGIDYIHQFLGNDGEARFRQRPEAHLAERYVDTQFDGDDILANGTNLLNAELAWVRGPFSFQTEYTNSWVAGRDGQSNAHFWGIYAFASWFLTGEHRNYDYGNGRFGRVKPKVNFNPFTGDWGAWEIAARYSYLDLNDAGVKGGKLWDVTAGLNWYPYPNLRFLLNYVHAELEKRAFDLAEPSLSGDSDIVQARFQVDF